MVLAALLTPTVDTKRHPSGSSNRTRVCPGLPLELLRHVDIDDFRRAGVSVTEDVLNLLKRHTRAPPQRRTRVPQVVEPNPPYAGLCAEGIEMPVHVPRLDGRTQHGREGVPMSASPDCLDSLDLADFPQARSFSARPSFGGLPSFEGRH